MILISNNRKNENFSFDFCFENNIKGIKSIIKGDTPLPPLKFACRAWYFGLLRKTLRYPKDTTTNPKNLVSQIAFGKRFANSWFVFAKLNFSDENFKTRPHLNILPSAKYLFLLCKNRKRFFWVSRGIFGIRTTGKHPPAPL